ncbi:CENP-C_C domain-containing protein [Caerostris darwini]|uniref:CENP-C_C domain-containing protein n=1 Tax=Caerostris darwini TaxID=1538125 RepID=A0AAV4P8Z9_9ARAC|nr:CENP-C_C domain-containing protein [Caerostris darwini]
MSNVKTRKFSKIPIRILKGNNKSLAARISTKNQTMHNEFETSSDENYYKSTSPTKRNSRGKSINISHGKRKISDVPITDLEEENELLEVENTRKDQTPHQKSVNISSVKTRKVSGVPITNVEEENELLEFENSRKNQTLHQKSTPTKGILKRKSINISSVKTRKVSGVPITNLEEENELLEFENSRKDHTPHQKSTPTKGILKRKSINISSVKTRKVSGVPITNLEEENEPLEFEISSKDQTPHQNSTPTTKGILKRKSINISSVKTRRVSGAPITNLEGGKESLKTYSSKNNQSPQKRLEFSIDENDNKSTSATNRTSRGKSINISQGRRKISDIPVSDEESDESLEAETSRKNQSPFKRFRRDENDNRSPSTTDRTLRSKSFNISSDKLRKVSEASIINPAENNASLDRFSRHLQSSENTDSASASNSDRAVTDFAEDGNAHQKKSKKRKIVSSKTAKNVSQQIKSPGKLRRSSRHRVAPLAIWRNERMKYVSLASGEINCLGLDEGRKEDDYALRKLQKKYQKKHADSKKNRIKKTEVPDSETGDSVMLTLYRPFSDYEWTIPKQERGVTVRYAITKVFTSKTFSFGLLKMLPHGIKEEQYSPTDNIHFVVVKGNVCVTIYRSSYRVSQSDSIIVPRGVIYSIKNDKSSLALLSFCTFKTNFFNYQR